MMNVSNRQFEVARLVTKSRVTNNQIIKELDSLSQNEWNIQCEILDKMLIKHDKPFDKGWNIVCGDFVNIGAANGVDEATVFVAYMDWKSTNKK